MDGGEAFLVMFVGGLLLLLFVGSVLGLLAFLRTKSVERRLHVLEMQASDARAARSRAPEAAASVTAPPPAPLRVETPAPSAPPREPVREPLREAVREPGREPVREPVRERPQTGWGSAAETGSGIPPIVASAAPSAPSAPSASTAPPAIPPSAPPAPRAAPAPRPASSGGLERWLGVRGAAVLGGIFLAIAGLLFFQYSIQQGWITKELRVVLGTVVGIGCILGGQVLRKRTYVMAGDALASGGAVVLYAAFWSAYRFNLVSFGVAFGLMVLVTATCCWLAWRNSSQLIAILGLVGGFATPLVLASGRDNPIGLFGYVLLLDLGFLLVAGKRRWPAIGLVGLLGTVLIQVLWTNRFMGPANYPIALFVLGVFALFFVVFAAAQPSSERASWIASQVGALLLPFAFAIYFTQRTDIGWHVYPLVLLCALLATAAGWMARKQGTPWIPLGAASGSFAVVLTWVMNHELETDRAWELAICSVGLALVYHVFCELKVKDSALRADIERGHSLGASLCAGGLMVSLAVGAGMSDPVGPWPWMSGAVVLALLLHRLGALRAHWIQPILASLAAGFVLFVWTERHDRVAGPLPGDPGTAFGEPVPYLALVLGVAALFLLAGLLRRRAPASRAGASNARGLRVDLWGAVVFPVVAYLALSVSPPALEDVLLPVLATSILLAVVMAVAASAARSGPMLGVAVAIAAFMQSGWTTHRLVELERQELLGTVIAIEAAAALLFTAWPFLTRSRWSESRGAWRTTALASPLWFLTLKPLYEMQFGTESVGFLPLALALPAGLGALLLFRAGGESRSPIDVGRVWYAAAALLLLTMTAPLQIGREWQTVTCALFALALVVLWRRFDRVALKYTAIALLGLATLLLTVPVVDGSYERFDARLWNWHSWDLLVPATAAILTGIGLRESEVARARPGERPLYTSGVALAAALASFAGAYLVFLWMNVEIFNAYAENPHFALELERLPKRDMTVSIAWTLFALVLLVIGVRRMASGPRWASLGLLLLTIGKVFLFDLGNLQGLYRVASFLGLAVCLLLVSLLYQRFVFAKKPEPAT